MPPIHRPRTRLARWLGPKDTFTRTGEAAWLRHLLPRWHQPIMVDVSPGVEDWARLVLRHRAQACIYWLQPNPVEVVAFTAHRYACPPRSLPPGGGGGTSLPHDALPVLGLDAFCAAYGITHINYLRLDRAGLAQGIVTSAADMLSKTWIDMLQINFDANDGASLGGVAAALAGYGYAAFRIRPRYLQRIQPPIPDERVAGCYIFAVPTRLPDYPIRD